MIVSMFGLVFLHAAEFVVFNVGQGNCNLFAPDCGVPILYDAGSDHHAENIDRPTMISEISSKLQSCVGVSQILNVVISHGDRDHHNYILGVLQALSSLTTFHFFFGGIKSQYPPKLIQWIEFLPSVRRKTFCFADGAVLTDPVIGGAYGCRVLARPVTDDKNESSLVLKISHPTPFSVLLMGDATGNTTAPILKTDVIGTTMLVANHHGADSDGSNDDAWVSKAEPEVVVFSASKFHHGHPNREVVVRYINSLRLKDEALHEFSYAGVIAQIPPKLGTYHAVPEVETRRAYYRALTRKAIFNTMNEGTMVFKLSNPVTVKPDKPFFSMFPLQHLTSLKLSEMLITNEELMLIAPKLYILQLLKMFDLSKNSLKLKKPEGSKAIDAVKCLLDKITAITKISLLDNECSACDILQEITDMTKFSKLELDIVTA